MQIFTTYFDSPLGKIEASATIEYLTSVLFVESQKKPSPMLLETPELPMVIQDLKKQMNAYFEGTLRKFDLKIKHRGTTFQEKVWLELENIPFGKTISYLELSDKIGNKKAIRAVGTTNGNNLFSIIVPCHRVIGSDGSLVGYAGDLWRKKWLLAHEARLAGSYQMSFF